MVHNKLKMNDSNTEFIIIGSQQQLDKIQFDSIMVGDAVVKAVNSTKDLRAYLDSTPSMEAHISAKCVPPIAQYHVYSKVFNTRSHLNTNPCVYFQSSGLKRKIGQIDHCENFLVSISYGEIPFSLGY